MDKHNFGKSVAAEMVATDLYYRKPRTLFWEHLFFGKTSPLRICFSEFDLKTESGSVNFSDLIFNLTFLDESDLSQGLSKGILRSPESQVSNVSFGALLGYCYVFGLQDLHLENVIPQKDYLQVIDNESVLTKMTLPHETLLLPFKSTKFEKAGCVHVFSEWPLKTHAEAIQVVSGFLQIVEHFISQQKVILSTFAGLSSSMSLHPIRVIVRDTKEYRNFLEEGLEPENPFYEFEKVQLSRKEVPYYFKYLNGKNLLAYTDPEGGYAPVSDPRFDLTLTYPIGELPEVLLSLERLSNHILPIGALFLSKLLIPKSWSGFHNFGNSSIQVTQDRIELKTQYKAFLANR